MSILNTANVLFDGETLSSNQTTTAVDEALTLVKTASPSSVLSGGTITYSVVISNPNSFIVENVVFTDPYDSTQVTYIADSFKIDTVQTIPDTTNPIVYTIPEIEALGSVTITFDVSVS